MKYVADNVCGAQG